MEIELTEVVDKCKRPFHGEKSFFNLEVAWRWLLILFYRLYTYVNIYYMFSNWLGTTELKKVTNDHFIFHFIKLIFNLRNKCTPSLDFFLSIQDLCRCLETNYNQVEQIATNPFMENYYFNARIVKVNAAPQNCPIDFWLVLIFSNSVLWLYWVQNNLYI